MKSKKQQYNRSHVPYWAVLIVVLVIALAGIVAVYNSYASASPPAGYTTTRLYCKEGRCGRSPLPGYNETRAYAKAADTGFGGQACATGVVYRSTTQAGRTKAPASDSSKDICVLSNSQLQFPNGI